MLDFHTHTGILRSLSKYLKGMIHASLSDLLEYMDACGVERAVVLPVAKQYPDIGEFVSGTKEVLEAVSKHQDRLIPFCAVDPFEIELESEIRHYVSLGCKGFGEHKVELPINHERSKRIYGICAELGIPVLIHIDARFNPDIDGFEKVLAEYPNTNFIAHGPGWWKEISAEPGDEVYPTGKIKRVGNAESILTNYANAYADISATSGFNALARDPEFSRPFITRNWRKLLFATDFPAISTDATQFGPGRHHIRLLNRLISDKEVMNGITENNAEKLLSL